MQCCKPFFEARQDIKNRLLDKLIEPAKKPQDKKYKRNFAVYEKIVEKYKLKTPREICEIKLQRVESALMMFFSFRYNFYWSLSVMMSQVPNTRPEQDIIIKELMAASNMALKRDKPNKYIMVISAPSGAGKSKLIAGWEAFNTLRYPPSSGIFASYDENMGNAVLGHYADFINRPYQYFFPLKFGYPNTANHKAIKLESLNIGGSAELMSETIRGQRLAFGPSSGTGKDGNLAVQGALHLTGGVIIDDPMPKSYSQKNAEPLSDYAQKYITNFCDRLRDNTTGYIAYIGHKVCVGDPLYEIIRQRGGVGGSVHEVSIQGLNEKTNQLIYPNAGGFTRNAALSLKKKALNGDPAAKTAWFTEMQQEYVEEKSSFILTADKMRQHIIQPEEYEAMQEHLYKQIITIDPSECKPGGNNSALMIIQIFTHSPPKLVSALPNYMGGGVFADFAMHEERLGDDLYKTVEHASKVVIRRVVASNYGIDNVRNEFLEVIKHICVPGLQQIRKNGGDERLRIIIEQSSAVEQFRSYLYDNLINIFNLRESDIDLFIVSTGKIKDNKASRWSAAKTDFCSEYTRYLPCISEYFSCVIPQNGIRPLRLGVYKDDLPLSKYGDRTKNWTQEVINAFVRNAIGGKHDEDDINDCFSMFHGNTKNGFWVKEMKKFSDNKSTFKELMED
jgi:hypothetical protein